MAVGGQAGEYSAIPWDFMVFKVAAALFLTLRTTAWHDNQTFWPGQYWEAGLLRVRSRIALICSHMLEHLLRWCCIDSTATFHQANNTACDTMFFWAYLFVQMGNEWNKPQTLMLSRLVGYYSCRVLVHCVFFLGRITLKQAQVFQVPLILEH